MCGDKTEEGYTGTLPVVLGQCGFRAKAIIRSGSTDEEELAALSGRFLGLSYDPQLDTIAARVAPYIRMKKKRGRQRRQDNETITEEWIEDLRKGKHRLTRRRVLAFLMSQYDPLGIRSPVLLTAKIMLRRLYGKNYEGGWDDPLPEGETWKWESYLTMMLHSDEVVVPRSLYYGL